MNCPRCGRFMKIEIIRDDGCRMYSCYHCNISVGEETEEWFTKMEKYTMRKKGEIKHERRK